MRTGPVRSWWVPHSAGSGNGEADRLGSITPGKLADLAAYPADPLTADLDDLAGLTPAFTIVGGRAIHDRCGLLRRG